MTLPKVIKANGFTMTQVMREDDIAIYRRTKEVFGHTIEHFEVIVIRMVPVDEVFGKTIPEHEKYPANERWGIDGFTCLDIDAAWRRVKHIREEREKVI